QWAWRLSCCTDGLEIQLRHKPAKTSRRSLKRLRCIRRPQFCLWFDDKLLRRVATRPRINHNGPADLRMGTGMAEPHTVTAYTDYKSPYAYLAKDLVYELQRDFPVRID